MSEALQELSTSQSQAIPEATKKLSELEFLSKMNSDQVLDDEIVMEEIEGAIKRIKRGRGQEEITSVQSICCMEVSYSRCGQAKCSMPSSF